MKEMKESRGCGTILAVIVLVLCSFVFLVVPRGMTPGNINNIPSGMSFVEEVGNSDYVGSYSIHRTNFLQEWEEWGEWTPSEYLWTRGGPQVCFGYGGHNGVFRSDATHQWVATLDGDRKTCLRLIKKK